MTGEELQAIVEAKIRERIQGAAQEIIDEAKTQFTTAVDAFYGEYDPIYYNRSYGLHGAGKEHYVNTGMGFEAGIKADASGFSGTTHDSPGYVFTGAFGMGIHGTSKIYVSSESSDEYMRKWHDMYLGKLPEIVKRHIGSLSV